MTTAKREQKRIAREILQGLSQTVHGELSKIPEDWNGYQLRAWIRDLMTERYVHELQGRLKREYENTRLVGNF